MVKLVETFLFSDWHRSKDWIECLPQGTHKLSRYHWYHIVSPSPWPFYLSLTSLPMVIGGVGFLHGIIGASECFSYGFIAFFFFLSLWFRDIIRESTFIGVHTKQVDTNTVLGFKLFLFTETMLFVSLFWAYLYSSLYPSVFIGLNWPPVGLSKLILDPFEMPLTNTIILVYSGFIVTLSHLYLRRGAIIKSCIALALTIIFGFTFLYIQYTEYTHAQFDISDGIYGSTFYMLTGFHGAHVIIGVSWLVLTLYRLYKLHFSSYSHTGFKLALIYWHFVDVVWIFVFLIVYVLGSDLTHPNFIYYSPYVREMGCIVDCENFLYGKCINQPDISKKAFRFGDVCSVYYEDLFNGTFIKELPSYVVTDQNGISQDLSVRLVSHIPDWDWINYFMSKFPDSRDFAYYHLEKNLVVATLGINQLIHHRYLMLLTGSISFNDWIYQVNLFHDILYKDELALFLFARSDLDLDHRWSFIYSLKGKQWEHSTSLGKEFTEDYLLDRTRLYYMRALPWANYLIYYIFNDPVVMYSFYNGDMTILCPKVQISQKTYTNNT